MQCTIEVKILPLVVASHLYLEIFDAQGKRIAQVNGFAVGRVSGKSKSVGVPGDGLRAFVGMDAVLGVTARCTREQHCHDGRVIFSGSRADVDKILQAMQEKAHEINQLKLPYQLLSLNSNTVFSQMVNVVRAHGAVDEQKLAEMVGRFPAPGFRNDFEKTRQKYARATPPVKQPPRKPPNP
jgi:hypothetical protein